MRCSLSRFAPAPSLWVGPCLVAAGRVHAQFEQFAAKEMKG
ncbi:Uncharacterised protein [Comamonas testosteroni]|uniref:Uncharacterized protein n=1 Tax=Comamonas testosteroni TaxID=285 RepID=A0A8B4S0Y4_COMTE|nr:Uncharacterised protein [Comamonas testosteroni]